MPSAHQNTCAPPAAAKAVAVICAYALACGMAVVTSAPEAHAATAKTGIVKISGTYRNADAKAMLKKINGKRKAAGVSTLKADKKLQKAAVKLAAEQAIYYGTRRPDGRNWTSAVPTAYRADSHMRRIGSYAVTSGQAVKKLYKKADARMRSAGIACFETEGQRYWVLVSSSHKASKTKVKAKNAAKTVSVKAVPWMLGDIDIEKTNSAPAIVYMKDVGLSCRVKNKGASNGASFTASNAKFISSNEKILRISGKTARSVGSGSASVICSVAGKTCTWETHCYINMIKGAIWEIAYNPDMTDSYKIDSDTGMGLAIPPTIEYAWCRYTTYIEYDGVRTYGETTDVFKVKNDAYTGPANQSQPNES